LAIEWLEAKGLCFQRINLFIRHSRQFTRFGDCYFAFVSFLAFLDYSLEGLGGSTGKGGRNESRSIWVELRDHRRCRGGGGKVVRAIGIATMLGGRDGGARCRLSVLRPQMG
jgi:hypothetical protein